MCLSTFYVTALCSCVILTSINSLPKKWTQTFIKYIEPVSQQAMKGSLYASWMQESCLLHWINYLFSTITVHSILKDCVYPGLSEIIQILLFNKFHYIFKILEGTIVHISICFRASYLDHSNVLKTLYKFMFITESQ